MSKPGKHGIDDDDSFETGKASKRLDTRSTPKNKGLDQNRWIESSLSRKVEVLATEAINKYVTSKEFKESLSETVGFDLAESADEIQILRKKTEERGKIAVEVDGKLDGLEQYSRRNNIRIDGIPQTEEKEDTDRLIIETIKAKIGIVIAPADIWRSHRVGHSKGSTPRQIICKFVRHNIKAKILKEKKSLREKKDKLRVNEDLTKGRLDAIKAINSKLDIYKLWTIDGTIHVRLNKDKDKAKEIIHSLRQLKDLQQFIEKLV
ncbi:predicted protein [Nematostella vectensis]|uniref:Uncharacterized protein n=1 Tax=Nematostella vectensis TaxID=45351 RepID=A7S3Y3_NEMVE|nr:predicted protein [Nematostella vectensis]|eukprot:XP_001633630.1 predicted protein [Nematostella vectensis]